MRGGCADKRDMRSVAFPVHCGSFTSSERGQRWCLAFIKRNPSVVVTTGTASWLYSCGDCFRGAFAARFDGHQTRSIQGNIAARGDDISWTTSSWQP